MTLRKPIDTDLARVVVIWATPLEGIRDYLL